MSIIWHPSIEIYLHLDNETATLIFNGTLNGFDRTF